MKHHSMKTAKTILLILLVFVMILLTLFANIFNEIDENKTTYIFKITNIDTTATNALILYDGNKKIGFSNFIVSAKEGVRIGDYVIKEKCSKFLIIRRKVSENRFIEVSRNKNLRYFAYKVCE